MTKFCSRIILSVTVTEMDFYSQCSLYELRLHFAEILQQDIIKKNQGGGMVHCQLLLKQIFQPIFSVCTQLALR